MECGLLGRVLGHSYSPDIHRCLGSYHYHLYEKEPQELETFLRDGDFSGLNVTIPYKTAVIPYCAELSPIARRLGAVNTIVRRSDGSLVGHNTDYRGFSCLLNSVGVPVAGKKCLVLGSGGASVTVSAVLKEAGAEVVVISRTGENNYGNLHRHSDAALIVNATPVGMYPNTGTSPVALDIFPNLEGVLDLIYNPMRTRLIMDGEARSIPALGGLRMLVEQARESAEWFTGSPVPDERVRQAWNAARQQHSNLVLVGMPGCGKTTLTQALSRMFPGRRVVDTDQLISEQSGLSIPEIFETYGEQGFRSRETDVLSSTGRETGLLIATGGGCVTRPENYRFLHQNGLIFWIQRNLEVLPTEGRPLSQANALETLYHQRQPLYRSFADYAVFNETTPEAAAESITELFTAWSQEGYDK